jgi:hypothetical protein
MEKDLQLYPSVTEYIAIDKNGSLVNQLPK